MQRRTAPASAGWRRSSVPAISVVRVVWPEGKLNGVGRFAPRRNGTGRWRAGGGPGDGIRRLRTTARALAATRAAASQRIPPPRARSRRYSAAPTSTASGITTSASPRNTNTAAARSGPGAVRCTQTVAARSIEAVAPEEARAASTRKRTAATARRTGDTAPGVRGRRRGSLRDRRAPRASRGARLRDARGRAKIRSAVQREEADAYRNGQAGRAGPVVRRGRHRPGARAAREPDRGGAPREDAADVHALRGGRLRDRRERRQDPADRPEGAAEALLPALRLPGRPPRDAGGQGAAAAPRGGPQGSRPRDAPQDAARARVPAEAARLPRRGPPARGAAAGAARAAGPHGERT